VHAKVVVADDVVSFGTVNLDAWALYRNSEIMMIARSRDAAALQNERLFEPDIARRNAGSHPRAQVNVSRAGSATSSRTTSDGSGPAASDRARNPNSVTGEDVPVCDLAVHLGCDRLIVCDR
jgi:hypothetical protein